MADKTEQVTEMQPFTLEERRRVYEEGVPQELSHGVTVQMRPVRIETLLESGDLPDKLTAILVKSLYKEASEEIDNFALEERTSAAEAVELIKGIDAVCRASLLDPDIVPYLPLGDRLWIYKLAFMPAEVLSRFRLQQESDVDAVAEGENVPQAAE